MFMFADANVTGVSKEYRFCHQSKRTLRWMSRIDFYDGVAGQPIEFGNVKRSLTNSNTECGVIVVLKCQTHSVRHKMKSVMLKHGIS